MIFFTLCCLAFIVSFISLLIIVIIIERFDHLKARTYAILTIVSRYLSIIIFVSFLLIGICCCIALMKFLVAHIRG